MKKGGYGWKGSLAAVMQAHNSVRVDGTTASRATQAARSDTLFQAFKDLRTLGYKIENVRNLDSRHVNALVEHWRERELSASTMQNRLSVMRTFAAWIGREGIVPSTDKIAPEAKRSGITKVEKTWAAQGVSAAAKIEEIREHDPRVAIQMELQRAFGMRVEESHQFKPDICDKGIYIRLTEGTKNGRERTVEIKTAYQRDVIERARKIAGPNKSTIPADKSLKQWRNHYYYVVRENGVTRTDGIVSHGLRHERLNELYQEVAGVASPVQGGTGADKIDHERAMIEVSQTAGHARAEISMAYVGKAD